MAKLGPLRASAVLATITSLTLLLVVGLIHSSSNGVRLFSGIVVSQDGSPLEAEVQIWAWPTPTQVEELRSGEIIPRLPLTKVHTQDGGSFTAEISRAQFAELRSRTTDAGKVDIEVEGMTEDGRFGTTFVVLSVDFVQNEVEYVSTPQGTKVSGPVVIDTRNVAEYR